MKGKIKEKRRYARKRRHEQEIRRKIRAGRGKGGNLALHGKSKQKWNGKEKK